jgi:hypothetical protein
MIRYWQKSADNLEQRAIRARYRAFSKWCEGATVQGEAERALATPLGRLVTQVIPSIHNHNVFLIK